MAVAQHNSIALRVSTPELRVLFVAGAARTTSSQTTSS